MRYPKHIILDLQPAHTSSNFSSWEGEFARATNFPTWSSSSPTPLTPLILRSRSYIVEEPKFSARIRYSRSFTLPIFDVHFLRKEKLYTKLKYSRCPQYDIVSGGFAAIFAGFIGFLISEKFGIELVDSGDFYTAFMYAVFITFSLRPLIRIYSKDDTPYHPLSPKYLISFTRDLLVLFLEKIKTFCARIFN